MPSAEALLAAALLALLLVLVAASAPQRRAACPRRRSRPLALPDRFAAGGGAARLPAATRAPRGCAPQEIAAEARARPEGNPLPVLYTAEDADPLVMGELYEWARVRGGEYGQRTAHLGLDGLAEQGEAGDGAGAPRLLPEVGVEAGPLPPPRLGDDGIPAEWAFPSTPIAWYAAEARDHFGPEGATPHTVGMFSLTEPDHDPLVGEDLE